MFTGIIRELGTVESIERRGSAATLKIRGPQSGADLRVGDSVAVNGACLTVTTCDGQTFALELSPETLEVTNLGELVPGSLVNLETSVRLSDLLGGHLVTGHIDGVGRILETEPRADNIWLRVEVPDSVGRYLLPKGSMAVDGVSLTVIDPSARSFSATIIPHTLEKTSLGRKRAGDTVNLEADLIGKYVEKFISAERGQGRDLSEIMKEQDLL